MDRVIWSSDADTMPGSKDVEDTRAHNSPTARILVPQEAFKPARHQRSLWDPQVIEFYVHGEKGIRLSDASGGNWAGFEGRDDRSLFGDERLQIIARLHVRLPTIVHVSPNT